MNHKHELVPFVAAGVADVYIAYRLGGWTAVGMVVMGLGLMALSFYAVSHALRGKA